MRVRLDKVHPISSHELKMVTHFYGLEVNELEFLHNAYEEGDESRFMSETTGIKIYLIIKLNIFLS